MRDRELLLVSSRDGATSDVGPAPGTDPAWSPDGALIAFAGRCTVYVVDIVSRATYPGPGLGCIPELTVGSPSWVDGGARISFSVCEVWHRCRLAFAPRLPTGQDTTVTFSYVGPDTAWSPDGYRLAWSCIEKGRSMLFLQDLRLRGLQPDCD